MQKGERERTKSRKADDLGLRHHLLGIRLDWEMEANADQQFLKLLGEWGTLGTASIGFIEPLGLQGFLFICVREVFSTPLPSSRGDVLIYQKTHDAPVSLLW